MALSATAWTLCAFFPSRTCWCGPRHQQRQPNHAVPHAHACRSRLDQGHDHQRSFGRRTRQSCSGAAAQNG